MAWFHHILIHFPIALSQFGAALLVLSWLKSSATLEIASRWMLYLAAGAALLTMTTGLFSADHVVAAGGDAARVALHRNGALVATGLIVIAAVLTWVGVKRAERAFATAGLVIALAAAAAVAFAAHLGGDMLHPGLAPWAAKVAHHHGPLPPTAAPPSGAARQDSSDMPGHDIGPSAAVPAEPLSTPPKAILSAAPAQSSSPPKAPGPAVSRPRPKPQPPAAIPGTPENHTGHQH